MVLYHSVWFSKKTPVTTNSCIISWLGYGSRFAEFSALKLLYAIFFIIVFFFWIFGKVGVSWILMLVAPQPWHSFTATCWPWGEQETASQAHQTRALQSASVIIHCIASFFLNDRSLHQWLFISLAPYLGQIEETIFFKKGGVGGSL